MLIFLPVRCEKKRKAKDRKLPVPLLLFFFFNKFIYLFSLAALGLCCCAWVFSSCGELGLLFIVVCKLLIVVASLAVEHGL